MPPHPVQSPTFRTPSFVPANQLMVLLSLMVWMLLTDPMRQPFPRIALVAIDAPHQKHEDLVLLHAMNHAIGLPKQFYCDLVCFSHHSMRRYHVSLRHGIILHPIDIHGFLNRRNPDSVGLEIAARPLPDPPLLMSVSFL